MGSETGCAHREIGSLDLVRSLSRGLTLRTPLQRLVKPREQLLVLLDNVICRHGSWGIKAAKDCSNLARIRQYATGFHRHFLAKVEVWVHSRIHGRELIDVS